MLVDLDNVEPVAGPEQPQDFRRHRAGSGADFQDTGRRLPLPQGAGQGSRQGPAAGQDRAGREIVPAKLAEKLPALRPVAHPGCLVTIVGCVGFSGGQVRGDQAFESLAARKPNAPYQGI